MQLWWGTDAADAPCSEVTSSGYGRGGTPPVNVHLRSVSVVAAGSDTLTRSNQGWCNRLDLPWLKLGGGDLRG